MDVKAIKPGTICEVIDAGRLWKKATLKSQEQPLAKLAVGSYLRLDAYVEGNDKSDLIQATAGGQQGYFYGRLRGVLAIRPAGVEIEVKAGQTTRITDLVVMQTEFGPVLAKKGQGAAARPSALAPAPPTPQASPTAPPSTPPTGPATEPSGPPAPPPDNEQLEAFKRALAKLTSKEHYRAGPDLKWTAWNNIRDNEFLPLARKGLQKLPGGGSRLFNGARLPVDIGKFKLTDFHRTPRAWLKKNFPEEWPYGGYDHRGVDVGVNVGEPLYAVADGRVVEVYFKKDGPWNVGQSKAWGNFVRIYHPSHKVNTAYCHLSEVFVTEGQEINAGTMVAKSGKSAPYKIGAHLHFGLFKGETIAADLDPLLFDWGP